MIESLIKPVCTPCPVFAHHAQSLHTMPTLHAMPSLCTPCPVFAHHAQSPLPPHPHLPIPACIWEDQLSNVRCAAYLSSMHFVDQALPAICIRSVKHPTSRPVPLHRPPITRCCCHCTTPSCHPARLSCPLPLHHPRHRRCVYYHSIMPPCLSLVSPSSSPSPSPQMRLSPFHHATLPVSRAPFLFTIPVTADASVTIPSCDPARLSCPLPLHHPCHRRCVCHHSIMPPRPSLVPPSSSPPPSPQMRLSPYHHATLPISHAALLPLSSHNATDPIIMPSCSLMPLPCPPLPSSSSCHPHYATLPHAMVLFPSPMPPPLCHCPRLQRKAQAGSCRAPSIACYLLPTLRAHACPHEPAPACTHVPAGAPKGSTMGKQGTLLMFLQTVAFLPFLKAGFAG